jgi:hypothetical protein
VADERKKGTKRPLPKEIIEALRADPWRDYPAVGDRACFRPDMTFLEVVSVSAAGVTSRVTGPADAPDLGAERTVSVRDWVGMHDEGTLLSVPEPPRVGEAWTDPGYMLWFVKEVSGSEVVFERLDGETARVGLGPDGQPDDGRGWSRVNVDTQGESRESWEGY